MDPTTAPEPEPSADATPVGSASEGLPASLPEPPVAPFIDVHPHRPVRPGQLTTNWSTVFWLAWAGVAGGFAAVWYSSRLTGLATWWLGPETEPRLILVSFVPFLAPLALAISALTHRRWLPWFGILGSLVTAAVAAGDVGRPARYHLVEFLLAAAGFLVSVASFAGMYRAADPAGSAEATGVGDDQPVAVPN